MLEVIGYDNHSQSEGPRIILFAEQNGTKPDYNYIDKYNYLKMYKTHKHTHLPKNVQHTNTINNRLNNEPLFRIHTKNIAFLRVGRYIGIVMNLCMTVKKSSYFLVKKF